MPFPAHSSGSVGIQLETCRCQVAILGGGSILMLAYMAHVAERDWQVDSKHQTPTYFVVSRSQNNLPTRIAFGTSRSLWLQWIMGPWGPRVSLVLGYQF